MPKNRVNPPKQVELPPEVNNNPQLKKAFDDVYFILFQMWKRTGAGDDFISNLQDEQQQFESTPKVDVSDEIKDDVVVTSNDYLTIGDQTIICTAKLTVTLNATPDDRELVKVHANNGRVDIKGNGKKINKEDDAIIRRNFTTWDILYIVEIDEWVII